MSVISKIKDFFRKGGAAIGMTNSLSSITDDPRIATDQDEVNRIRLAQRYYRGSYRAQKGVPFDEVRYFNSQGKEKYRTFNTINVTQMVAKRQASICLNSGFTVSIDSKSSSSNTDSSSSNSPIDDLSAFIDEWLEQSGVNRNLESKLEQGMPAGGFAARPYVDGNRIKIAWVRAEQFYSLDSNTEEISQAAIASKSVKVVNKERYYYTLLEFHQWANDGSYQINNELYKSNNSSQVGEQVPLGTDDMYNDIVPKANFSGNTFKRPLFVYFKCPGQNNLAPESPLGVGFVNNCKNILDAINYTHDSFVWEVRMGRRKVLVPPEMTRPGDEYHEAGRFEPDQDTYQSVDGLGGDGSSSNPIVEINPDIRVQDYEQTMQHFLHELENAVGLSSGTFSTDSNVGITTATQVVSENSMTYQTRASYLNRVTKFLSELIQSVVQLAQASDLFDDGKALLPTIDVDNLQISVHYDDGVFVDKDTQAKQDLLAVQAGTMPKKRYIMRTYGKSEVDAEEWLNEIKAETPDPSTKTELGVFGSEQ